MQRINRNGFAPFRQRSAQRGFVLLPVVLALGLIAAIAFLMNRESGMGVELAAGQARSTEAFFVAEAGLNHARWQFNNDNCAGYANLSSTPFGDHAYSATVTPTEGSPVTIVATGSLADGATHTLTRRNVKIYATSTGSSVRPGAAGKDTYVNDQGRNNNYGAETVIGVDSGGAHDYYALLEFDVSGVPAGIEIESATLSLYLQSFGSTNTNAEFTVYRMLEPWAEGTGTGTRPDDGATYSTSDGSAAWTWPANYDAANPIAATKVDPSFSGWHRWDLTEPATGWYDNAYPNFGLVIIGNNQVRDAFFVSGEGSSTEPPSNTVVQGPAQVEDTHLGDATPDTNYSASSQLFVSNKSNNKDNALIRFDLGAVPAGNMVSSAVLELDLESVGSAGTSQVHVHRAKKPWVADEATWNQYDSVDPWAFPGGDYDPAVVATANVDGAAPGLRQWDVTSLAAGWVDGSYPNEGLLLKGSDGLNQAKFTSADGAGNGPKLTVTHAPDQRPVLAVSYYCECGAPCSEPGGGLTGKYRDEFTHNTCDALVDYTGSDGTLDWSPWAWSEIGDDGDPCSSGVRLRDDLGDWSVRISAPAKGIERTVDLSTFSGAYLSFDYRRDNLSDALDSVTVSASDDGGSNWVDLDTLTGPGTDADYLSVAYDIGAYATNDTVIRFVGVNLGSGTEHVLFDNVQIGPNQPPWYVPPPDHPVLDDAKVYEGNKNGNYGADPDVKVGKDDAGGGRFYTSLVRFDVSGLPPGATVTAATLRLYLTSSTGTGSIDVRLNQYQPAWDEETVVWNDVSEDGGSLDTRAVTLGAQDWFEWTVPPELIHEWRDGVTDNNGFVLVDMSDKKGKVASFASKEYVLAAYRPQLVLEYTEP